MLNKSVPLVLIEVNRLLYIRLVGKRVTDKAVANKPLTKEEVETFRTNPSFFLGDEPESA